MEYLERFFDFFPPSILAVLAAGAWYLLNRLTQMEHQADLDRREIQSVKTSLEHHAEADDKLAAELKEFRKETNAKLDGILERISRLEGEKKD